MSLTAILVSVLWHVRPSIVDIFRTVFCIVGNMINTQSVVR